MNTTTYAIIAIIVMAIILMNYHVKSKELKKQLELVKGMLNGKPDGVSWSSLGIINEIPYAKINQLSQEIKTYYRNQLKVWSALELGEYIDDLENSGMGAGKISLLSSWLKEGIAEMKIDLITEMFVTLIEDSLQPFDSAKHKYLMNTKTYIVKAIVVHLQFNDFIFYLTTTAETRDNGYPDEAKTLLKSEIIKLKHRTTVRK